MNSLEASRVLNVLDDALDGIRLLSYVTYEVLEASDRMRDIVGPEFTDGLSKHNSVSANLRGNVSSEQIAASTLQLWRHLKKSPTLEGQLSQFQVERSAAILQFLHYFERLRQFAHKRLTTTVEEDSSNLEYYGEVKEREEKAVAERTQLEQKLKLQRIERQKALSTAQAAEDQGRSELAEVQGNAAATRQRLTQEAGSTRRQDQQYHGALHAQLTSELAEAKAQLARLREEAGESEGALSKAKKRTLQDVEAVVAEYDSGVGGLEAELAEEGARFKAVQERLEKLTVEYTRMKREQDLLEARERAAREARRQEAIKHLRHRHAAKVIQKYWKLFLDKKKAEAKKAKKKGAKGKGKKK